MIAYRHFAGRIVTVGGKVWTVERAEPQRRFYVDDISDLERRIKPTRPGLAEAMIAHNLEMATQLTACIALAISANDDFATPDTDPSGSALAVPVSMGAAA